MNGKMTMQVNQETVLQAFQLWADEHFATPMLVTSVNVLVTAVKQISFEISLELAVSRGSTSVPLPPGDVAGGAGVVLTQEALSYNPQLAGAIAPGGAKVSV